VRGSEKLMKQQQKDLHQFVQAVGFSNGARSHVVEAAAVGAELLDDLWLATGRR